MAIYVEVCLIAVHSFADVISQPTDSENISRTIQRDAIIKIEAFAGKHLHVDCFKSPIVSLERMCRGHHSDDTSRKCLVASVSGL